MNESLEAIAMVQGHSGQRINLLSVHSPFFSEKFRVRQSSFPRDETYGLTTQLRRSASSIPSNIAEGCGREGDAELARFCLIARGSASELQYQLLLAHDLKLIPSGRYEELSQEITEIKRMKDKRNKRHVGSIRPAFDRFPGRITASYNAFYVALRGELPRSTHFFWEAGFSNKLFTGNRVP